MQSAGRLYDAGRWSEYLAFFLEAAVSVAAPVEDVDASTQESARESWLRLATIIIIIIINLIKLGDGWAITDYVVVAFIVILSTFERPSRVTIYCDVDVISVVILRFF